MRTRIKELDKSVKTYSTFLEDLNNWVGYSQVPNEICNHCYKSMKEENVIAFPCGHSYHIDCLEIVVFDTLNYNVQEELKTIQNQNKLSSELKKRKEEILTEDCPSCGLNSVLSIRLPIIPRNYIKWSKDLSIIEKI